MGMADRRYDIEAGAARGTGGLHLVSFNTWLIIVNSLVFVLQEFTRPRGPTASRSIGTWILEYGHFSTFYVIDPGHLEFWRVLTFQFLHANIMHLFFNMLGLYVFGGLVERRLGFKKYAAFYLVCGIFGGLFYLALNLMGTAAGAMGLHGIPGLLYGPDSSTAFSRTPLIGASAGVFGVIVAAAYIAPNSVVSLIFPPISLRMKTFAYAYVGLALFSLLIGTSNAGGEAAHLGGALAGFFFIRNAHLLTDFFDVFTDSRRSGRRGASNGGTRGGASGFMARMTGKAPPSRAEVDRILDKLRAEGLAGLTEREKDTLRRASEHQRGT